MWFAVAITAATKETACFTGIIRVIRIGWASEVHMNVVRSHKLAIIMKCPYD